MVRTLRGRRAAFVLALALILLAVPLIVVNLNARGEQRLPWAALEKQNESTREEGAEAQVARDFQETSQGVEYGGAGGESFEAKTAAEQFAEARTAPNGIVPPGGYSDAYAQLTGLTATGGSWTDVTKLPYDADDPNYRDYYSNSSGGSGLVTGRITGLAADDAGNVYVGGADGGVWRSTQGGGNWEPIADTLPSLSTGALELAADGALWYATGEANTGGTSYVGNGVYRLDDPTSGTLTLANRVGGEELESTTINAIRFTASKVWVATLRGIYWHDLVGDPSAAWQLSFAPNPTYLPGGANAGTANAAYKNIVNDIAIDPTNASHMIAGIGWRSGDNYNGFYETTDGGAHWAKVNLKGGLDKNDIGNVSFAYASDGSKLYVMNQSPKSLNSGAAIQMTYLDGIYVSNNGKLDGPWTRIASADKLAASGSALAKNFGIGYRPGIQSWYNQFLLVDPGDASHVFAGLEEVFETKNGGTTWNAVGPYWNFYFSCWAPDSVYPPNGDANRCPQTTHPDQHSVAVGTVIDDGTPRTYLFVGNDGGVYRRPLDGAVNGNGNATDWESLNDGTIDALQYYAVDVGAAHDDGNPNTPFGDGVIVSGGLQDNGGSILQYGSTKMSSNFGGDGGDVLVDPANGCNILQEYVFLSLSVTQDCASPNPAEHPNAFLNLNDATTWKVAPPDINARFIAPFVADDQNIDYWLAGGNSVWFQKKGFAIRSGSEWQKVYTFGGNGVRVATAMAYSGDTAIAAWCGPCNNSGFKRGVAIGHYDGTTWEWTESTLKLADDTDVPNRYVGGVAIDGNGDFYLAMNGFNRRFTEGPGAGIGHIFKSTDDGLTWTDIGGDPTVAGSFPDVPASSIKVLASGAIVVGTDLGVVISSNGGASWQRLGDNFPATVVMDVELGPDNFLYAATHGRGIWRIEAPGA